MALNFPATPTDGDEWTDPSNTVTYKFSSATNSWYVIGGAGGTAGAVDSVVLPITGDGSVATPLNFNIDGLGLVP